MWHTIIIDGLQVTVVTISCIVIGRKTKSPPGVDERSDDVCSTAGRSEGDHLAPVIVVHYQRRDYAECDWKIECAYQAVGWSIVVIGSRSLPGWI